jgi:nucleoside-diphosphate-sugar epimerase
VRVVVTGASGFIGAHLVRLLVERGHDVRAMVRRGSDLRRLDGAPVQLVYADVMDGGALGPAVADAEVVFHLAGSIAAPDAAAFDRVNRAGTVNLLRAVQQHDAGLRRFVFISSTAAGGPSGPDGPRTEDAAPSPVSAYGRSKLAAERAVAEFGGSVRTTVLRPPIVYGSGDAATLELFRMVRRRMAFAITGPERRMSFVHVRDLVEGALLAASHDAAVGETFALPGPEDATMLEFQHIIGEAMGRQPITLPVPAGLLRLAGIGADVGRRWRRTRSPFGSDKVSEALQPGWLVSGEKARRRFGFAPRIGLREGVAEALAWYQAHGWL